jgi:hypothetical protein
MQRATAMDSVVMSIAEVDARGLLIVGDDTGSSRRICQGDFVEQGQPVRTAICYLYSR